MVGEWGDVGRLGAQGGKGLVWCSQKISPAVGRGCQVSLHYHLWFDKLKEVNGVNPGNPVPSFSTVGHFALTQGTGPGCWIQPPPHGTERKDTSTSTAGLWCLFSLLTSGILPRTQECLRGQNRHCQHGPEVPGKSFLACRQLGCTLTGTTVKPCFPYSVSVGLVLET